MSLATLAMDSDILRGVMLVPFDEAGFIATHKPTIQADVERARRKMTRGEWYKLLVTPPPTKIIPLRCAEKARTHVVIPGKKSEEHKLLRSMFRNEAMAHHLEFQFDLETHYNVPCADHLEEEVFMLAVYLR